MFTMNGKFALHSGGKRCQRPLLDQETHVKKRADSGKIVQMHCQLTNVLNNYKAEPSTVLFSSGLRPKTPVMQFCTPTIVQ